MRSTRTCFLAVLAAIALIASALAAPDVYADDSPKLDLKTVMVINDHLPTRQISELPEVSQPAARAFAQVFPNATFQYDSKMQQLNIGIHVKALAQGQPFVGIELKSDCPNNSQFHQISPGHESPPLLVEKLDRALQETAIAITRWRHPALARQPLFAFHRTHHGGRKTNWDVQLKTHDQLSMIYRRTQ